MTQLINEIETKIQETQLLITNYEQYLVKCKKILAELIKELTQIKQNLMKNTNTNSPLDSKQTK